MRCRRISKPDKGRASTSCEGESKSIELINPALRKDNVTETPKATSTIKRPMSLLNERSCGNGRDIPQPREAACCWRNDPTKDRWRKFAIARYASPFIDLSPSPTRRWKPILRRRQIIKSRICEESSIVRHRLLNHRLSRRCRLMIAEIARFQRVVGLEALKFPR